MNAVFSFTVSLLFFFTLGSVGNAFKETENESELILSLYRGILLAGFLSFFVYLYPPAYFSAVLFFLLIAVFGIKKSLWFKTGLVGHYLCFFTYIFLWQCLFPFYYGGGWYGDWFEHYERVLFFQNEKHIHYSFLGTYTILARTPFFHLSQAFVMRQAGSSFFYFQGLSTLLNTLFFFPFFFFLKRMNRQRFIYLLYVSPYILRMATYTFPKAFAAFFILSAYYFYLFEDQDKKKYIDIGFLSGCAVMAHQSGFFYIVALGVLLLWHRRWEDFSKLSFFAFLPVSPWIVYGMVFFSLKSLFVDTPVFSYGVFSSGTIWLQNKVNNLVGALFPFVFLRDFYPWIILGLDTSSYAFYSLWNKWQNFVYGALPAAWTIGLTFYAWRRGDKRISFFPKEIILFVIPLAFFCDILTVNNIGVPLGVAQNGMMPLILLLGLYALGRMQEIPKKILVLVFIEYLSGFAVFFGLFLWHGFVRFLSIFFQGDISLVKMNNLELLFGSTTKLHFLIWIGVVFYGIVVLRKLSIRQ